MSAPTAPSWLPQWDCANQYPGFDDRREWRWDFLRRNSEYQKKWNDLVALGSDPIEHSVAFRGAFGLMLAVDPTSNQFPEYSAFERDLIGSRNGRYSGIGGVTFHLAREEVAFVFDLRLPIGPQLEHARLWLKADQQRLISGGMQKPIDPKPRKNLYPIYLRLLDAEAIGATQRAMAKALFAQYDDELSLRHVKDGLRAARKLRDGGYRGLVPRNIAR